MNPASIAGSSAGRVVKVGQGDVANYVTALEDGLERLATLPVSLRLIRELHERLLQRVRGGDATPGSFRTSQNWIGRPGCPLNDAEFVPPPVPEMLEALDHFEKYLHADDEENALLVRLALIHYQFETIHPFLDGNGRIGRLLITLLLVNWNLLPSPLLYLSAYFERQREQYYAHLRSVSQRGAWREWILFFLQGVAEQSRDATARAKRLQDLQAEWRSRLTKDRASARALLLVDKLFEAPIVTIPQAQRLLGVPYLGAQHAVERLVDAGILRQVGDVRHARSFVAEEILNVLGT